MADQQALSDMNLPQSNHLGKNGKDQTTVMTEIGVHFAHKHLREKMSIYGTIPMRGNRKGSRVAQHTFPIMMIIGGKRMEYCRYMLYIPTVEVYNGKLLWHR